MWPENLGVIGGGCLYLHDPSAFGMTRTRTSPKLKVTEAPVMSRCGGFLF